jgi:hypothetical protein
MTKKRATPAGRSISDETPGPHLSLVKPADLRRAFAERRAEQKARALRAPGPPRVWDRLDPIETNELNVREAHFPPVKYRAGKIASWWTLLASVPVPAAQVGDRLEVLYQVQLAGYPFKSSAWTPVGVTVTHGEAWKFDSTVQQAAYTYTGQLLLPFGGWNINNRGGAFYHPHRMAVNEVRHVVKELPVTVNVCIALSCLEVDNAALLQVFWEGGQSAVYVDLWRPRA